MPNQRKKDKRGISVYVPRTIKNALVEEAEKRGVPMSELITELYRAELERLGYNLKGMSDASGSATKACADLAAHSEIQGD